MVQSVCTLSKYEFRENRSERHTLFMGVHEIFFHIICIFLLCWIKFGTGAVHCSLIETFKNTGTVKQYFVSGHKWVCTFHFCLICVKLSLICTCIVEHLRILWKLAKWRPYFFLIPGNKITFIHVLWKHMIHKKKHGRVFLLCHREHYLQAYYRLSISAFLPEV